MPDNISQQVLLSETYNDQLSKCEDGWSNPDQGVDDCTKPNRESSHHR